MRSKLKVQTGHILEHKGRLLAVPVNATVGTAVAVSSSSSPVFERTNESMNILPSEFDHTVCVHGHRSSSFKSQPLNTDSYHAPVLNGSRRSRRVMFASRAAGNATNALTIHASSRNPVGTGDHIEKRLAQATILPKPYP